MIIVEAGNPCDPDAMALLQASHDLMTRLFNPEDNHFLSIDALSEPCVHFFVARKDGNTIGTAALKQYDDYGEIKSMFVAETARGTGAADALMRQLEDHARELDLSAIKLETGDVLYAAHKLYARHGFETCGPFGSYAQSPSSIFMTKPL